MPKVSVIMSVYKEPANWMRQSIDSILAQTFRDFEFIIVNDCPEKIDNEVLLSDYKKKDARVVVIKNDINLGLTKSLNKALSIAKGDYIARMDADDISLPSRFEKQVTFLDRNPDICAVGSWLVDIDENGKTVSDVVKYDADVRWIRAQMLQNSQLSHPSSMFRRNVKDYVVKYDESIRYAQDYALWVSILPYGDITNIPEVLLKYRTSSKQITSSKKTEQQECAGIIQRRAFALYDFYTSESFLNTFYSLTIQHRKNLYPKNVKNDFCAFFKGVKKTGDNQWALEIIYSTYLSYLRTHSSGSVIGFIITVLNNSSFFMLQIGCGLFFHLFQRKYLN